MRSLSLSPFPSLLVEKFATNRGENAAFSPSIGQTIGDRAETRGIRREELSSGPFPVKFYRADLNLDDFDDRGDDI